MSIGKQSKTLNKSQIQMVRIIRNNLKNIGFLFTTHMVLLQEIMSKFNSNFCCQTLSN